MKLFKNITLIFLTLLFVFALIGCNTYEQVSGELPEGYEPDPKGKIRLDYYIAATESDRRSVNDWVSTFCKKYPEVTIETNFNTNSRTGIAAEIAAHSVGDVFFLWEIDVYNYAITQKALMPLDYYVESYNMDLSDVASGVYEMGVLNGRLYMVMRDYSHVVFAYNKDMIISENLTDPVTLEENGEWTWDTYKEYCEKLTKDTGSKLTSTIGSSMFYGSGPVYVQFLEGFGGKWFDSAEHTVSFISDDNVVKGLREMIDLIEAGYTLYKPQDQTGTGAKTIKAGPGRKLNSDFNEYTQVCFQGTVFSDIGMQGKTYESQGIDWDVVSLPATPVHKVGTGATGFAVYNGTGNADAAAALCLSLYTEEGQLAYNGQEGGAVPILKGLGEQSFWRVPFEDRKNSTDGINYNAFVSFPESDTYGQIECVIPPEVATIVKEYMQNLVPDVLNNTRSFEDTLTLLETQANELWESY